MVSEGKWNEKEIWVGIESSKVFYRKLSILYWVIDRPKGIRKWLMCYRPCSWDRGLARSRSHFDILISWYSSQMKSTLKFFVTRNMSLVIKNHRSVVFSFVITLKFKMFWIFWTGLLTSYPRYEIFFSTYSLSFMNPISASPSTSGQAIADGNTLISCGCPNAVPSNCLLTTSKFTFRITFQWKRCRVTQK